MSKTIPLVSQPGSEFRWGHITRVRGSVVDVSFDNQLPPLHQRLQGGQRNDVVLEVVGHLDPRTVRCIALSTTQGLARGGRVENSGRPLEVPVGHDLRAHVQRVW